MTRFESSTPIRGLNEVRTVERGPHLDAVGHERLELREEGGDPIAQLAHVGLVLLGDRDHRRGQAVVARDEDGLLEVAHDRGDVSNADARARGVLEHHRVEDLVEGVVIADRAERRLALLVLERAGGQVLVLAPDALRDVADRESVGRGARAIDLHAHLAVLQAADLDARDAGELARPGLDLLGQVANRQRPDAARVDHGDEHDRCDLGGDDLTELGLLGVGRQIVDEIERRADVVHGGLVLDGVEGLVEVDRDHRDVRLRRRAHLVHVADGEQLLLELGGDESLDLVRRRARPPGRHDDLVQRDVVEVLDLRQPEGAEAADHADDEEHVHEDGLTDAELGQRHRGTTRSPGRSWETTVTATRSPSDRPSVISTRSGRKGTGRVETRTLDTRSCASRTKT